MSGGGESTPQKPKDFGDLKFPYHMHCPKCKVKIKIAKPELVGQRMPCPSCKAKIDVVTPDEDAHVAYGVTELDHKHIQAKADADEEELETRREERQEKERLAKKKASINWALSVVFFSLMVGGVVFTWVKVMRNFNDPANAAAREKRNDEAANNTLISVD